MTSLIRGSTCFTRVRVQKHDVHVAEGIQLAAAVAADRHQREPAAACAGAVVELQRRVEQMPQHDVHEAARAARKSRGRRRPL